MTPRTDPSQLMPLVEAGRQLVPLHRWDAVSTCSRTGRTRERGKSPVHTDWTRRDYSGFNAAAHMAGGRNVGVRLSASEVVVDVDPRNVEGGAAAVPSVLRSLGVDPEAYPMVRTGGGGLHLYASKPSHLRMVDGLRDVPGVEFKSLGRQVVAPGSVHPNGLPYAWVSGGEDLWLGAPGLPEDLLQRARRSDGRRPTAGKKPGAGEHPPAEVAAILARLDPESFRDHDRWLSLMMACHHASAGEACDEFVAWCAGDPLYADDGPEVAYRWDSLRGQGVGLGTLYMFMREAGVGHLVDRRARYDFPDDLGLTWVAP